jgi:PAS domain S-box-containing protein
MPGVSTDQAERFRRALFLPHGDQFAWRIASVAVSLVSVALIAVTLGYKLRGAEPPSVLLLALLSAFVIVVMLLSRFLRLAYHEQTQTAGALETTEREFQSIFENALDAILILDDKAVCREANPAAEQLFGIRRRELLGQSIHRFYKDSSQFNGSWEQLLAEKFQQGDAELVRDGQSPVFVEFTAKADCLPGQHVMILRDITQRRHAQLSLLESEERFQQMARNIQEIFWMIDADTKHALYVNQAYETITGRSCESLRENPSSYEDLIHPEDRVHVLTKLDEATQSGQFNERFRILRPGGEVRWVWVRGFPVRDGTGTIRRLVGTGLEVTAQKQAEEQVTTNLAMAKAAWAEAEALRKATLALTQDLRMDSVMDTLLRSLAELVPYTCARVLIPEGGPHVLALGEKLFPEPAIRSQHFPLTLSAEKSPFLERILTERQSVLLSDTRNQEGWQTFNGHEHLRSWLSVPLFASDEYQGFLSVGHSNPDQFTQEHLRSAQLLAIPAAAAIQNARLYARAEIYGEELEKRLADLHQAETALAQSEGTRRASEESFQKVFRFSPIPFSITTLDEGRFIDVNAAFESRYGYSRDEVIGRTVHEVAIWDDPADRAHMIAQLNKGGPVRNLIARIHTKSGEIKVITYSADRIQFEGKACVLAISEEILRFDPHQSN